MLASRKASSFESQQIPGRHLDHLNTRNLFAYSPLSLSSLWPNPDGYRSIVTDRSQIQALEEIVGLDQVSRRIKKGCW